MITPNYIAANYRSYQNIVADAMCQAIRHNNVPYTVTRSSGGAHLPEKGGVVHGLYDMEQKFNQVEDLNVVHLHPTYFMENTLSQIGTIQQMGIMGSPVKGDFKFPMVGTKDVAEVAANFLKRLNFSGKTVHYIPGPSDVSYNEAAKIMGNAIGNPDLKYVEFPYSEAKQALIQGWGVSENLANAMVEFMKSLNVGRIFTGTERAAQTTTTTSFENFAPVFAQVFKQGF